MNDPRHSSSNLANTHHIPSVVLVPNSNQLNKRQPYTKAFLALLGLIVVLNLNIIGSKFFGSSQFLSPIILLLAAGLYVGSGVSFVYGIPKIAQFFGLSLVFVTCVGALSGVAFGLSKSTIVLTVISDLASVVVFFAAVATVQAMVSKGGVNSESFVIQLCYWLSFLAAMSIFLPFVLPDWQSWVAPTKNPNRYSGLFGNPNPASMACLSFMVFGLARTAYDKKVRWVLLSTSLAVFGIYCTGSRTGLASVFLVGVPVGLIVFSVKDIFRFGFVALVLGGIFLLLFQSVTGKAKDRNDRLGRRYAESFELLKTGKLNDSNTGGRLYLAEVAWKQFKKSPIIGTGISSTRPMPAIHAETHNYYLQVLVETGLVGFVPFLIFWWVVGLGVIRIRDQHWKRVLVVGIFLAISFYAIGSHTIFTQRNQIFLLGCAIGMLTKKNSNRRGR